MQNWDNYSGSLKPYLGMIVSAYERGVSPNQISRQVREKAEQDGYHYYDGYWPDGQGVTYALRRIGVVPSSVSQSQNPEREAKAWQLREAGWTLRQIGSELGLCAERVRGLIESASARRRRAERRERSSRLIDEWLAERQRKVGRPLDMGGPRDIWLERSPWDAL